MPDLTLLGCRTLPLLSYLKTLGVFRHVAGAHPHARLWWNVEATAVLHSGFDEESLVDFFLDEYEPTPITSPWNGGSGYFPSTKVPGLQAIEGSSSPRLGGFADVIRTARSLLRELGIGDKIDERKLEFLYRWRAVAPDGALAWLDAAVVMGEDRAEMNPLLGTGGNDGRFDFSGNFVEHLTTCLAHVFGTGGVRKRERSATLLRAALFDEAAALDSGPVGMFDPVRAGLPNSASSATESAQVNPWEFVLMLEGATLFGGNVARRLSAQGAAFPFTVRRIVPIGMSLGDTADESARGETWLPVWDQPASIAALQRFLSEGRLQDGRGASTDGRSVLRAVGDVGVDRGVRRFERIVYARRMGRNFIAVPTGSVEVARVDEVVVLRSVERWLGRARRASGSSVASAARRVDRFAAEVSLTAAPRSALERWLLALADLELALSRVPSARAVNQPTHIHPLAGLDPGVVPMLLDSVECRLALVLAAVGRESGQSGVRQILEPVETLGRWRYAWSEDVRLGPPLEQALDLLIELASRSSEEIAEVSAVRSARLDDVQTFIEGGTNDRLLARLAFALTFCPPTHHPRAGSRASVGAVDRLYAVTRLATSEVARRPGGGEVEVNPARQLISVMRAGDAERAAREATRRLRADSLAPYSSLDQIGREPARCRRIAAALAFPLHPSDRAILERAVLTPVESPSTEEGDLT